MSQDRVLPPVEPRPVFIDPALTKFSLDYMRDTEEISRAIWGPPEPTRCLPPHARPRRLFRWVFRPCCDDAYNHARQWTKGLTPLFNRHGRPFEWLLACTLAGLDLLELVL